MKNLLTVLFVSLLATVSFAEEGQYKDACVSSTDAEAYKVEMAKYNSMPSKVVGQLKIPLIKSPKSDKDYVHVITRKSQATVNNVTQSCVLMQYYTGTKAAGSRVCCDETNALDANNNPFGMDFSETGVQ